MFVTLATQKVTALRALSYPKVVSNWFPKRNKKRKRKRKRKKKASAAAVEKKAPPAKELNLKFSDLENTLNQALESVQSLGVSAEGISGTFEMRGIYGGVSLGAAVLCLLGAIRERLAFAAPCFVATYMGGYVLGRGASLAFQDTALNSNWMFAGFELVMFLLAGALLTRTK